MIRVRFNWSPFFIFMAFSLGINEKVEIAKPIIPTIFLEDKEVKDDDILVHVDQFNIKDDFNGKVIKLSHLSR